MTEEMYEEYFREMYLEAVQSGNVNTVVDIGKTRNLANIPHRRFISPLGVAIKRNDLSMASALLIQGADKNACGGKNGTNLFIGACVLGRTEMVRLLCSNNVDMNATNDDGMTGLMFASENGYLEICKIISISGADLGKKCNKGKTARDKMEKCSKGKWSKMYEVLTPVGDISPWLRC